MRWVIDPIDGTTNYLYGHPGYGISIAVEVDGEAVAAWFTIRSTASASPPSAAAARPATASRSRVSGETEPASALVATGFGYTPEGRTEQAEVLARLIGSIRDIRRMGAAAVDLCSVACGRVDAYYERGLNHWDLAAGELIAGEAGATVELDRGRAAAPGLGARRAARAPRRHARAAACVRAASRARAPARSRPQRHAPRGRSRHRSRTGRSGPEAERVAVARP